MTAPEPLPVGATPPTGSRALAYRSEDIADLAERLQNAAATLRALGNDVRLRGKREGVLLALDYLRAYEVET